MQSIILVASSNIMTGLVLKMGETMVAVILLARCQNFRKDGLLGWDLPTCYAIFWKSPAKKDA